MTEPSKPDWRAVKLHVAALTGDAATPVTIQTFDDRHQDGSLAGWRHGRLIDPEMQKWIVTRYKRGAGVFITINETDGQGRRGENIKRYRAAFVDLDGAPLPASWPLEPSFVVESSPGKYHIYWLLTSGADFVSWLDLQARLAAYYKGDRAMADVARVLRLVGFDHMKSGLFRVHVIGEVDPAALQFERHTLQELAAAHPCEYQAPAKRQLVSQASSCLEWDKPQAITAGRSYLENIDPPEVGDRNHAAYAAACHLNDLGISPEESLTLLIEVWNPRLTEPLEDQELHRVVKSASRYKKNPPGAAAPVDPKDDFEAEAGGNNATNKPMMNALIKIEQHGLSLNRSGEAPDTIKNAYAAIYKSGLEPAWDELKQTSVLRAPTLPWDEKFGRVVNDHVLRVIRLHLVRAHQGVNYQPSPTNLVEAVATLAYDQKFNPVLDYIDSLMWDGTPRVERLFSNYFNCGDDAYTRAVSMCFAVGAVRRMRQPGCKFDTMPVLQSPQGWLKSSAIKVLFGSAWYSDSDLGNLRDKDSAMKLRGYWVQEFAEIDSLTRAETGALKAFCSRATDRQRDPYGRIVEEAPRRCVFVATVNEGGYLKDSTGGRRFWPLQVLKPIDIDRIERDRDQIWAEAALLEFLGESDVLSQELWPAAAERQADQTSADPWGDSIRSFLEQRHHDYEQHEAGGESIAESVLVLPPGRVHTSELFALLGVKDADQTKDKAQRLRTVMEADLKWYHRRNVRVLDRNAAGYVRTLPETDRRR